jgi:hypothetical protein
MSGKASGRPSIACAKLPRTAAIRLEYGLAATAASCARRNFAAATICIALVILRVAFTEEMRFRRSFRLGMGCSLARALL